MQWNLTKGTKAFLPRLGAPIQVSRNPAQPEKRNPKGTFLVELEWELKFELWGIIRPSCRLDASPTPPLPYIVCVATPLCRGGGGDGDCDGGEEGGNGVGDNDK